MFKLAHTAIILVMIIFLSGTSFAANINAPNASAAQVVTARGILRATESTDIAASMTGTLLETNVKSGQYFSNQSLMAQFDCAALDAEKTTKTRAHNTLSLQHETAAELFSLGAAGQLEVKLARSKMEQALAEIHIIKARLKNCHIYAPYNGYVTEQRVFAYETPQLGQVIYSIQRAGPLELSLIIPAQWIGWMKTGQSFTFAIDETGENFNAKVIRIGAAVDPASQTIEITAKPIGKIKAIVGMSGVAAFEHPQ